MNAMLWVCGAIGAVMLVVSLYCALTYDHDLDDNVYSP